MPRIAVIDDDPVEHLLITEMGGDLMPEAEFECFTTLDAFLQSDVSTFTHIFLDRRLPPYNEYQETLPEIAATGFSGDLVMMTAHDPGQDLGTFEFKLIGPIDKLELIRPDILTPILAGEYLAA